MSVAVMSWAWDQPIRPGLKIVLLALADHADNDGKCWPGVSGVAKKCGLSCRQVVRATGELEEFGLIRAERRAGNGDGRKSNVYVLNVQSDNMSHCGQSDILSHSGKVTSATGQSDICDSASKEEPSIEPSDIPPISPRPKTKKSKAPFVLPDWVEAKAWDAFEDMRKRIHKPLTDYARSLALDKLAMLQAQGHAPTDVLNQSTLHSWQGLFPIRNDDTNRRVHETTADRRARIGAAIDDATRRAFSGKVG